MRLISVNGLGLSMTVLAFATGLAGGSACSTGSPPDSASTGGSDGVGGNTLHSDTQHFWPFGLNQASEAQSAADLVDH